MSCIVGNFQITDSQLKPQRFAIQHNEQNRLKGLVWAAAGSMLTGSALALTAVTAAVALGNTLFALANPVYLPIGIIGTAAVAGIDYALISATSACFNHAIHHLGPEYQIVKA
jgi:hypothetical protein